MPILPKQELRQLVSVASTDDALRQLLDLLAGVLAHSKVYKAINLLSGQWQELDEQVRLNLLPFKEASTHRARINAAVLDYLEELPDEIGAVSRSQTAVLEIELRQSVQTLAADTDWEYDLFFSFSSKNLDAARAFCYALRGYGLRVFFSHDDLRLRGGHSFGAVIDQALRRSRHFLLFCTPDAMQSEWVRLEHDTFFQQYHLADKLRRSFHIAEGPGFRDDLVPAFYRRYQRVRDAETLLHTFAEHIPAPAPPPPSAETFVPPATKTNPADEVSWKIACKANTIAAYQGYLDKWINGRYVAEAADRLENLANDQALWDYLNAHSTDDSLQDNLQEYLEAYPEGQYAAEARTQIAAMERKRAEAAAAANRRAKADKAKEAALKNARAAKADKKQVEAARPHELPEMVLVKGGTFQMGEKGLAEPVHAVTLSDFEIGKYPVTQKQWTEIMGTSPSHFKGCDDCPVEKVSWNDVQEFLKKLNTKFPGKNFRLPTEAEWEYAARGGNQSKGYAYAGGNDLNEVGWHYDNAGGRTHPVGKKKGNELDVHDMSGNVWEWCQDAWHNNYQGAPTDGRAWIDGGDGTRAVLRGGSWIMNAWDCRVAFRIRYGRSYRNGYGGFRLARDCSAGGR